MAECFAGAWLLSKWRKHPRESAIPASSVALVAAWWLIQPLALFAFSWLTGNSVFVDRYLSVALPGAALTATAAAAVFLPAKLWKPAAAILGAAVLLFMGHWQTAFPPHHNSNWRGAAETVNGLQASGALPVICPSAFIEARPPVWNPAYQLPGFLYAPLSAYPVQGRFILFPFDTSPEAERYAAQVEQDTLLPLNRFILYGPLGKVRSWTKWFAAQPELAKWHNQRIGDFGDVGVFLFWRPTE
jgi:hypothetical protein